MIRLTGLVSTQQEVVVLKQNRVEQTYPIHSHSFYEYFLVVGGRALHEVNGTTQLLERGSLVLVRPDDEHCYKDYGSPQFIFYNAGIPEAMMASLDTLYGGGIKALTALPLPKQVQLNEGQTQRLETELEQLRMLRPGQKRDALFSVVLAQVIYYVLTGEAGDEKHRVPEWMARVLSEMEKEENFVVGLPRLLALSHYSQEHINREFRRYLDMTPTQYINEKRLRCAYRLLTTTRLSVMEVCGRCGFQNISHFYTCYRSYFGHAPGKERK